MNVTRLVFFLSATVLLSIIAIALGVALSASGDSMGRSVVIVGIICLAGVAVLAVLAWRKARR